MIMCALPLTTSRETSTPGLADLVHLLQQVPRIHHDAVGDHRGDVRVQDAGGDQLELQQPALGDDGVARVVAALVADHEVHPVREVVDRLALALVSPLGPEHDGGRHGPSLAGGLEGPRSHASVRTKWYAKVWPPKLSGIMSVSAARSEPSFVTARKRNVEGNASGCTRFQ